MPQTIEMILQKLGRSIMRLTNLNQRDAQLIAELLTHLTEEVNLYQINLDHLNRLRTNNE